MRIPLHGQISSLFGCATVVVACASGAGCEGKGGPPDAAVMYDAAPDIGTLSLDWSITYAGETLSCEQVGAISVRVIATPQEGGTGTADAFNCATGAGTTMTMPAGYYTVEVALVANNNEVLLPSEVVPGVQVIKGQDTSLGSFPFPVDPRGHVDFSIDAQNPLGNCTPEADGGTGITSMRIEYRDAQNQCVPTTFVVGDGANQLGGEYVSDCLGSPAVCIHKDQSVRAEYVPSGPGGLYISGYRGAEECYTRNSLFTVSGNGRVTTLAPQALALAEACAPAP